MKKLFENWNEFINEARRIKIWSSRTKITIKKPPGAAAVIDDTLALIRGIPSITVVNSDTDQLASSAGRAVIEIEFKFIPRSSSLARDLKAIKHDILRVSTLVLAVSPVQKMVSTLERIQ